MNEWTPSARAVLEQHLNRHRARFVADGAEADEVIGDLRQHVEHEAAAPGFGIVTEADVRRILAKVDPDLLAEPALPPRAAESVAAPKSNAHPPRPMTAGSRFLLWLFGVILPAFTLGFELYTNACAGEIFDPTPTWLHALLVAWVPLTHAAALLWLQQTDRRVPVWLWWAQSAAAGVAGAYALVFLPLTPFAVVGLIFAIGFLPLSPLIAWVCALVLGSALRRQAVRTATTPPRFRWLGGVGALLLLVALSLPGVFTRHWAETAAHGTPDESTRAVQWLRRLGSEEELLRACYGQVRDPWGELWQRRWTSPEQIQTVFFRVTGQPYNAVKPPLSSLRGPGATVLRDFEWDNAVGGEAVAGHVSGLSLRSSRLDAMGNADDGWAYTEWTLEFRNEHERQPREARAELQLPPGGAVSRVTLWVNGEEREAAFAGRGEVRAAYQQVAVVQQRDPILVTTSGPDRVLMQCFPVPAGGGTMKVRLGITAPLAPLSASAVAFVWPRFAERNFAIRDEFRHYAWLETPQPAVNPPAGWNLDASRSNALHATVSEREAESAFPVIQLRRDSVAPSAWSRDERSPSPAWVRQHFNALPAQAPGRLALVLDGGRGGQAGFDAVRAALQQSGGVGELGVWIASDGVLEVVKTKGGTFAEAVDPLTRRAPAFVGGHDPVPALEAAWNWAAERPGSAVLWVHGPLPVLLGDLHAITQRLERTGGTATQLLDLQASLGPNRAAKEFANLPGYHNVPRLGSTTEDLTRLLRERSGTGPQFGWQRERTEQEPRSAVTASRHLVRLWALDRIELLRRARHVAEAVELAGRWQLVTAVSGAVVLENKAQFAQAGLTPVDPLTTPSIVPEPETWALLGVGLGLVWILVQKRPTRICP
jgi:hypothetical protein